MNPESESSKVDVTQSAKMNPESESKNEIATPQLQVLKINYPAFDGDDVDMWFVCLEAAFEVNGIKSDKTKFNALIVALGTRAKHVYSTISRCSEMTTQERYSTLKTDVIAHFHPSETKRISTLLAGVTLGDQKPSSLLSQMRRTGGAGCSDKILANIWVRALPPTVRSILAAMSTATLDEQAKVADKIMEAPKNEIDSVQDTSSTHQQSSLEAQVAALTKKLDDLLREQHRRPWNRRDSHPRRYNSHHRSQSRERGPFICYYHRRYGNAAKKCENQRNPEKMCQYSPVPKN